MYGRDGAELAECISNLRPDESRELTNVLQRIVENAGVLLEVRNCSVALSDAKGMTIVTRATRPGHGHSHRSARSRLNEDVAGWVAEHREPLVIDNVRLDPRFKRQGRTAIGSMICIPLVDQGTFMGLLTATSPLTDAFSLRQVKVLTMVAEQILLAMTNARYAQQLREASGVKAKFFSLVSHELRAPLNSINGYLDLALAGAAGELNEQQREFMQRARAGSEHLYALIEDLLFISRADAGQLHLNREEISLEEIITDAIEQLEITAVDNDIAITVDVAEDVPPVWADSVRMQQVLRNLISNALRFTSAGGSISVAASRVGNVESRFIEDLPQEGRFIEHVPAPGSEDEIVEIAVHDTGCGIAAEYQQRIFERFYQVPRSSGGRTSGQGLGLAVVKMIVELHGGRVSIESTPGEGSKFSFTLPCLPMKPTCS
jgi:signal transduction histidine kinase